MIKVTQTELNFTHYFTSSFKISTWFRINILSRTPQIVILYVQNVQTRTNDVHFPWENRWNQHVPLDISRSGQPKASKEANHIEFAAFLRFYLAHTGREYAIFISIIQLNNFDRNT